MIPDIYQEYRDSVPFHILKFFFVFVTALIYSMIVYFIPFYIFHYNFQDGTGRVNTITIINIINHFFSFLFIIQQLAIHIIRPQSKLLPNSDNYSFLLSIRRHILLQLVHFLGLFVNTLKILNLIYKHLNSFKLN